MRFQLILFMVLGFAIILAGAYIGESADMASSVSKQLRARVDGIDVSHWQGTIDWNQVYDAGYRFAFAKATESTTYVDDYFDTNMQNGHAAGLYMGAYHFARPNSPIQDDAIAEADHFVDTIMPYIREGYLVPALDLEENDEGLSWSELTDWANTFCSRVYERTGVRPVIYTSAYWASNLDPSITQWDLWIAHWTYDSSGEPDTGVWPTWAFWQYSDQGSVPGISGNVDLDVFNGDLQTLVDNYVIGSIQSTPPQPFYDRQAAYGYAYRWWDSRNPHYNDYSNSGGDCANFVSQCLIAGGLSLWQGYDGNGGGVYSDSNGTIPFCDYLHQHLVKYQDVKFAYVTSQNFSVPDWLDIGDVIIFGNASGDHWQHATIVVYRNGDEVGVAGHTTDCWNRSISTFFPSEFDRINYYHIEDGVKSIIQPFRVTASSLNVRVGPSTDYQIIGTIQDGEVYVAYDYYIDSQGRRWWHFFYDDRAAWCAAWYTENVTYPVFKVNVTTYLNVRTGPGVSYTDVGEVYHGMLFAKIGQEYNSTEGRTWYNFWWSSESRWCASEYTDFVPEIGIFFFVLALLLFHNVILTKKL